MFDIAWTEMLVIAIVLIVVVGPKELPGMLRTFGKTTARLRTMAGEFRKQFDEALKEAELDDLKKLAEDAKKLNPAGELKKAFNPLDKAGQDVRAGLEAAFSPPKTEAPKPAPAVTPPDAAPAVAAPEAPARAELVLASGQVHLNERVATVGEHPLERGQRLSTAAGRACFTIDPGIDVCLGEHSVVALESLAPSSVRVRVASGTVLATLSKRPPGSTFALLAADVTALARGTVFAVKHAAPVVEVSVLEGVVDVARAGRDTKDRVAAHGRVRWTADAAAPTLSAVGRGEEARLWSLGAARELWSERELGVLHVARAEGFVSAAVDDEAALPLPLSAFVPAGRRRITLGTASGADVTESVEIVAGERREIVPALPASSPAPSAKVEAPDPDALLAAARRELARGDARAALALYQRFRAISPGSAEAATVRVTMGKLELDLGRPARALGHFDAYLAGGGPLAPEALAGKIRALQRLGRTAEERRAIDRYLRAYPNGFEAPVLQRRRRALDAP